MFIKFAPKFIAAPDSIESKKQECEEILAFFDRDGVVNLEDEPYGHKASTFYFAPGFFELFLALKIRGAKCFLTTNQSGINRGKFPQKDLIKLCKFMQKSICSTLTIPLRRAGANPHTAAFDGIFYCPHEPAENCSCRKPKSGMFFEAQKRFNLDFNNAKTLMFGDRQTDLEAAKNAGIKTRILINQGTSFLAPLIESKSIESNNIKSIQKDSINTIDSMDFATHKITDLIAAIEILDLI